MGALFGCVDMPCTALFHIRTGTLRARLLIDQLLQGEPTITT